MGKYIVCVVLLMTVHQSWAGYEIRMKVPNPTSEQEWVFYFEKDKYREEMSMGENKKIDIYRRDTQEIWTLHPDTKSVTIIDKAWAASQEQIWKKRNEERDAMMAKMNGPQVRTQIVE